MKDTKMDKDANNNFLSTLASLDTSSAASDQSWQSMLANAVAVPQVKGIYYNGKSLYLDGYDFIGCRFDNCHLYVNTVNFQLINCVIDPATTSITYGAEVVKILKLFHSRHPWADPLFPGFVPVRNADGTMTISSRKT